VYQFTHHLASDPGEMRHYSYFKSGSREASLNKGGEIVPLTDTTRWTFYERKIIL
jgi:hypothetical protein